MRIAVVHDRQTSQDHAILIVTVDGRDFVLDNMTTVVDPIENVTRYRAYYAINNSGWWAYIDPATRFAGTQIAAVQYRAAEKARIQRRQPIRSLP